MSACSDIDNTPRWLVQLCPAVRYSAIDTGMRAELPGVGTIRNQGDHPLRVFGEGASIRDAAADAFKKMSAEGVTVVVNQGLPAEFYARWDWDKEEWVKIAQDRLQSEIESHVSRARLVIADHEYMKRKRCSRPNVLPGDRPLIDYFSAEAKALIGKSFEAEDRETEILKSACTQRYSVMIARFPGQNQEHPASTDWVIDTIRKMDKDPRISKVGRFTRSDTPITMVRNLAVRTALEADIDYLLMIDADMAPDLPGEQARPFWDSSWEFMLERRRCEDGNREFLAKRAKVAEGSPLPDDDARTLWNLFAPATIAAPYCGPAPNECVYVFKWKTRETQIGVEPDFRLEMFEREDAAIRGGIEKVAALPTGLILYDMRVFKKLDPPWFQYEFTDQFQSAKATTEDVFQTRNASLLGMPQFVNWDAWAGHVKLKTVPKPTVLTSDTITGVLRDAFARGHKQSEQLRTIRKPSGT